MPEITEKIVEYLPLLIPLMLVQLGLMVAAIVHIATHKNFKFGNQIVWILISVLVNVIGPVLYFVIGRGENDAED